MPLPVADEGIARFLQRSENRRNSASPNDSPGTAKRKEELSAPAADPAAAIRIWEKGFSSHSKRGGNSFVRAADSTSAQLQKAEVGQLTNQITDTVVY